MGWKRNLILHALFSDLVLLKFEAHSQTHSKLKGSKRELYATHKTTMFLPSLTPSDSSSVPVSELHRSFSAGASLFLKPYSTSKQKPFPDTKGPESSCKTYRSHLFWFRYFLGSLPRGEEQHWRAAAPLGTLLNK